MAMPIDLILVRHGQSEQNLASHAARQGDKSYYSDEYRARHVSKHRLTPLGREQAEKAGDWLKTHGFAQFDRRYVSSYVRAKETAALLNVDGPNWYVDPLLREREWGEYDTMSWEERSTRIAESVRTRKTDSFYWVPPNGESIAEMTVRLRTFFDTWHRECSDKKVLVVCHGEVIWGFRFMLERMSIENWTELEASTAPGVKVYNCQILHYTRRNPETGELVPYLNWMRSVNAAQPDNSTAWQPIIRRRFTDEELLDDAQQVKPLFEQ
jgi:NAD+ kinase